MRGLDRMQARETLGGQILSHYQILEKIGSGGMGEIYKARDTKLQRIVAIKLISPALIQDPKALALFRHEAIAASAIQHPNICTIFEIDSSDSQHFIVMEFVDGRSLREILNERGRLPQSELAVVLAQLCDALAGVHEKGLVHRDIKPDNILISRDGKVKITDFGLAKLALASAEIQSRKVGIPEGPELHEDLLTSLSQFMGTILYMSPEQVRGEEIDLRTDIWSLGVVIYEALTGKRPFDEEHRHAVLQSILNHDPAPIDRTRKGIHKGWQKIVAKSLRKDRNERYRNVDELAADLDQISHRKRHRTWLTGLSFLLIAAAATLLTGIAVQGVKNQKFKSRPWLKPDSIPKRITSSPFTEYGRISPDGKKVVYQDAGYNIYIKTIATGEIKAIAEAGVLPLQYSQPFWSPANDRLIFMRWAKEATILVSDTNGVLQDSIPVSTFGFSPCFSPDNQKISYVSYDTKRDFLHIFDIATGNDRTLDIEPSNFYCWAPDSKHIVYAGPNAAYVSNLKILDVETGKCKVLHPKENVLTAGWWTGGIAWSPDGRYIVYTGYDKNYMELFALGLNPEDYSAVGEPVQLTHYEAQKYTSWPTFTADGKCLSYNLRESNTDIHFVSLDVEHARFGGDAVAVANDLHNDMYPCWTPDGQSVVFSSNREGNYDLYRYEVKSRELQRLTFTEIGERFPLVSPDGTIISYWFQGAVWGIRQGEEKPFRISPASLFVNRNYAWLPDGSGMIVSALENLNSVKGQLYAIAFDDTMPKKLFDGLLEPDFAFSPDGETMAIMGFPVRPDRIDSQKVVLYDLKTNRLRNLMTRDITMPRGSMSWTPDGKFILHDRYGENGLFYELFPIGPGKPVPLRSEVPENYGIVLLEGIHPSGKRVLITSTVDQSDVWLLGDLPE
jgi:serine/threonine protein kinase